MVTSIQKAGAARTICAPARRSDSAASRRRKILLSVLAGLIAASLVLMARFSSLAAEPELKANTSRAAREDAVRSIPLDKVSPEIRSKVATVLDNASIFRRLPVQVADCEPELFHFLVRQPEVVVNIWQVMGVSNVSMERPDETHFRCSDGDGTTAHGEFVFRNHDTQVLFAEGVYDGPLFPRPVRGQAVIVLKTACIRETNGRYYVTARLDTFLHVDNFGVEMVAKMFQGWLGHTIDHNFGEAVAFLGSVSHAAENNPLGMRRMAAKLNHVDPEYRQQFVELTDHVAEKMSGMQLADGDDRALSNAIAPEVSSGKPVANNRR
jgi:hypothetical protein